MASQHILGLNANKGSFKIEERASQYIIIGCNGTNPKCGGPNTPTCAVDATSPDVLWPITSLDQRMSRFPTFSRFCRMGQVSLQEVYRHSPFFQKGDQLSRDGFRNVNSITLVFVPVRG